MAGNVEHCDGCGAAFCARCEPDALTPGPDRRLLYCERCQAYVHVEDLA